MNGHGPAATRFVVVGIGADGWAGLSGRARSELTAASVVYGSVRQVALLPESIAAQAISWTSPMSEHLQTVLSGEATDGDVVHLLASGDPMFHGLGSTVVKAVGADRVTVLPAPSSASLAAARLGWDLAALEVVSLVTAEPTTLIPALTDGARVLVLSRDADTPTQVAELLRNTGFGWSMLSVLGELGGPDESAVSGVARSWTVPDCPALNVVAIDCIGPIRRAAPGLPDDQFDHDGQLTKQTNRAVSVAALAPGEGQLLWDVGAGAGSVGIEWLRQTRTARAIAFEADPQRADRIAANARSHGVADRLTIAGAVPAALEAMPDPDVIFLGGGLDAQVLELCLAALFDGGRLVANAVTLETEHLLVAAHAEHGGTLTRLSVATAAPLGAMTAWRPALPVVQWVMTR
ncbi:MAG: precorrin-6y C5,15-methyltransferase (decarboxylating) subunit CbiE [Gordonia sp. (in: high G+C Gram-positive bacteria)]|uniref:precorrin-6y C5,15-methyltransferase (decarboxylating) subunit CbiE n=1 Tax=Gordonia sp. (in: high G+C Gram-positive bacteria) TaxID=84139 RepID=UPI003BB74F74